MTNEEIESIQDEANEACNRLMGGQAHAQYLIAMLLAELVLRMKKGDV